MAHNWCNAIHKGPCQATIGSTLEPGGMLPALHAEQSGDLGILASGFLLWSLGRDEAETRSTSIDGLNPCYLLCEPAIGFDEPFVQYAPLSLGGSHAQKRRKESWRRIADQMFKYSCGPRKPCQSSTLFDSKGGRTTMSCYCSNESWKPPGCQNCFAAVLCTWDL